MYVLRRCSSPFTYENPLSNIIFILTKPFEYYTTHTNIRDFIYRGIEEEEEASIFILPLNIINRSLTHDAIIPM